jgi:2-keto-4-pentenoate hydratase/2-oxohepta-3-ene-1,7-dioic acid hydratase in catechol pathway
MKLLSFTRLNTSKVHLGVVLNDSQLLDVTALGSSPEGKAIGILPLSMDELVTGSPSGMSAIRVALSAPELDRYKVLLSEISYAPPLNLKKNVFCIGRNYREHIIEGNIANGRPANSFPEAIEVFSKPPTAVVGHNADVLRHASLTVSLDYEVELGVVIGKAGRDISEADALDHVFGYTVINDITARDLQKRHGQWFKGKSLDTSCPMGPLITHKDAIANPNALKLRLSVNGEERQSASTDEMIFTVQAIIAQLSAGMTLEPGDIIATGTPKGVGFAAIPPRCLNAGDVITAYVEGVGELRNVVVD